ncbi:flavodoxin family protein [Georgenia thermotolerans]|uniref:Flavodoxin n=1 Tax=Georgenia thermotolerans TaxID=527326 RepID=A0A7J5UP51_9MICO|nr:flavodoxin domain-containing protein [Georgenia thermotolerans]KAE8764107.1 flavodoxin [Georgenia thermotolerans]
MDVAVVYETHYGQTRAVAEAIAEGAREAGAEATVMEVGEATPDVVRSADLIVVGAPTHVLSMSRHWTRGRAHPAEVGTQGDIPDGVREWLATLPAVEGEWHAAAFDTHLPSPLSGGATHGIARGLRRHGFTLVGEPERFTVEEVEGPLRTGERERARAWGEDLARRAAQPQL